jgi:hypothetical protein
MGSMLSITISNLVQECPELSPLLRGLDADVRRRLLLCAGGGSSARSSISPILVGRLSAASCAALGGLRVCLTLLGLVGLGLAILFGGVDMGV